MNVLASRERIISAADRVQQEPLDGKGSLGLANGHNRQFQKHVQFHIILIEAAAKYTQGAVT